MAVDRPSEGRFGRRRGTTAMTVSAELKAKSGNTKKKEEQEQEAGEASMVTPRSTVIVPCARCRGGIDPPAELPKSTCCPAF